MIESAFLVSTDGVVLWKSRYASDKLALLDRFLINTFLVNAHDNNHSGQQEVEGYCFDWHLSTASSYIAVCCYQAVLRPNYVESFLQCIIGIVEARNGNLTERLSEDALLQLDNLEGRFSLEGPAPNAGIQGANTADANLDTPCTVRDIQTYQLVSDEHHRRARTPNAPSKKKRIWDDTITEANSTGRLDFSEDMPQVAQSSSESDPPSTSRPLPGTLKGNDLPIPLSKPSHNENFITAFLSRTLGIRSLTTSEIEEAVADIKAELLRKNVNESVAIRICDSLKGKLSGNIDTKKLNEILRTTVRAILQSILTPDSALDLIADLHSRNAADGPYIITIFGVNGVGKSTSLAKLSYYILQHKLKVMVVAGDTFRSGAVEQLKAHVRNLRSHVGNEAIDLYEGGYGKDASAIAKKAIEVATSKGIDVVIIDTAGRRHNDTRLMSGLERFMEVVKPHRALLVAEALAGSDAIQQAMNFNASLGAKRRLDGFIVTKCDSVGNMVGTLVNMTHATGLPILFLGTGQNYGDLRSMNVDWVCSLLLL